MTDTALYDQWFELQRRSWEQWAALSRKAMGLEGSAGPGPAPGWADLIDGWWKAMAPATPEFARAWMDKLIDQGKDLFRFAETLALGKGPFDAATGIEIWNRFIKELSGRLGDPAGEGDQAFQRLMSFWELPLDNWQRMLSSLSPLPGDLLRNMPHEQFKNSLERALSAPGLGYTREEQAQYQELTRAALEYQAAYQDYVAFYQRLGLKSIERMGSYLQGVMESGQTIDSVRALYDNWVSCCETAYAEEVATPEYARIHGRLINAQMALKKRLSLLVDEYLGALNMPTRRELRTLQIRLQETRRENKALERRLHELEQRIAHAEKTGQTAPSSARRRTRADTSDTQTP